jgi:hypothetical protein
MSIRAPRLPAQRSLRHGSGQHGSAAGSMRVEVPFGAACSCDQPNVRCAVLCADYVRKIGRYGPAVRRVGLRSRRLSRLEREPEALIFHSIFRRARGRNAIEVNQPPLVDQAVQGLEDGTYIRFQHQLRDILCEKAVPVAERLGLSVYELVVHASTFPAPQSRTRGRSIRRSATVDSTRIRGNAKAPTRRTTRCRSGALKMSVNRAFGTRVLARTGRSRSTSIQGTGMSSTILRCRCTSSAVATSALVRPRGTWSSNSAIALGATASAST